MKLHRELTARTIFGRRPRTHDHGTIDPELVHLSGPDPLNTPTTSAATHAVVRVPEFLMTEQTHADTLDLAEFPGRAQSCWKGLFTHPATTASRLGRWTARKPNGRPKSTLA